MTAQSSSRVESAFEKLLEQLVPHHLPGESEEEAERRWGRANNLARTVINTPRDENTTQDVTAISDVIRRALLEGEHGYSGKKELERVTRFGNLYSRLLAQPVLSQKRGILWFLWKASQVSQGHVNGINGSTSRHNSPNQQDDTARASHSLNSFAPVRETPLARSRGSEKQEKYETESPVIGASAPAESAMLRDLPYTLQGLSSSTLPFGDKISIKLPVDLPVPLISLLHALGEPALLYKSLSAFAESSSNQGLAQQSLRAAISSELRGYLALVAQLEGQIRAALQQVEQDSSVKSVGKAGVTLKRLLVWTKDATLGLRLMSLITEKSVGRKGGELISMIHSFAISHGDEFVYTFADKLLRDITKPFYTMLRAWIYDGELQDPYKEFFVLENEEDDNGAASVWDHKYQFQPHMVPSIMSEDFAKRVFLIGKSLNFIRYSCADSAWVDEYSRANSHGLSYGDTAELASSVDTAYSTVMTRLLLLMEKKFSLYLHLQAMKKYLLLGQGDFIASLMESLSANLDGPANNQYRHTLTGKLEGAIRSSNAQYDDPDVLRRLDSRMLELSHGEIGWDVFTLEYRIDAPLDVIVTPWASKQYLKVFNFLWRVKRVEFALDTIWRRCMTGARGVLASVSGKLAEEWKLSRACLAEMVHFINQLQWYILFEVIEAGWEKFQTAVRKPGATLDTLIEAHKDYLKDITRKGLLAGGAMDFTSQLHELLKLILAYRDAVDSLYSLSVTEFTRRQEQAARMDTRTNAGRWGVSETVEEEQDSTIPPLIPIPGRGSAPDGTSILEQLRTRLRSLRGDFKARVSILLGDLRDQPDRDMRHLGTVMNFNDAYTPARRRRPAPKSAGETAKAQETGVKPD